MRVTAKGQVTIPKDIRDAAGVAPGSEVAFSLEGSRIVITALATGMTDDRRTLLRGAAAKVRSSFEPEFRRLGAKEIMDFLRGSHPSVKRGRR